MSPNDTDDPRPPNHLAANDAAGWTRRDARLGALFLLTGLLVTAYAFTAMQNGAPVMLWGTGWLLGPLMLLLGGNALWRSLRSGRS